MRNIPGLCYGALVILCCNFCRAETCSLERWYGTSNQALLEATTSNGESIVYQRRDIKTEIERLISGRDKNKGSAGRPLMGLIEFAEIDSISGYAGYFRIWFFSHAIEVKGDAVIPNVVANVKQPFFDILEYIVSAQVPGEYPFVVRQLVCVSLYDGEGVRWCVIPEPLGGLGSEGLYQDSESNHFAMVNRDFAIRIALIATGRMKEMRQLWRDPSLLPRGLEYLVQKHEAEIDPRVVTLAKNVNVSFPSPATLGEKVVFAACGLAVLFLITGAVLFRRRRMSRVQHGTG